ncbi:MAG: DUF4352 domain-containing protein [Eubacteriales bacterium]|nr:DUF4352 domain-containing protein [Eubacteriales bacterium]
MKKKMLMGLAAAMGIALLTGCGSGTGYAKDGYAEGRMGDTMHTYFFDYTVNSAYTCGELDGYAPEDGNQLMVADITVKNTSTATITMYDTDFQVQWNDESEDAYDVPVTYYEELSADGMLPAEYDLAVNEERTGQLVFEVPDGEADFSVSYMEIFDDGTETGSTGDTFFVFFTAEEQ